MNEMNHELPDHTGFFRMLRGRGLTQSKTQGMASQSGHPRHATSRWVREGARLYGTATDL
jgi:hypothetical protein